MTSGDAYASVPLKTCTAVRPMPPEISAQSTEAARWHHPDAAWMQDDDGMTKGGLDRVWLRCPHCQTEQRATI